MSAFLKLRFSLGILADSMQDTLSNTCRFLCRLLRESAEPHSSSKDYPVRRSRLRWMQKDNFDKISRIFM